MIQFLPRVVPRGLKQTVRAALFDVLRVAVQLKRRLHGEKKGPESARLQNGSEITPISKKLSCIE